MTSKDKRGGKPGPRKKPVGRATLVAACSFCERRFKNKQAVRAHLKACPAYQIAKSIRQVPQAHLSASGMLPMDTRRQVAANETAAAPSPQTDSVLTKPGARRRGRDSQESLLCLLDTHEALVALRNECADYYRYVRLTASQRSADQAGCPEWASLYLDLDQCRRDCFQMILHSRLNSLILFDLYQRGLALKQAWLRFRRRDVFDPESEERHISNPEESACLEQLYEEESQWDALINKIKRLYVGSL